MLRGPQLPAVRSETAIAVQVETGATVVTEAYRPKSVQRGVLEIMLAFPTVGMADDDRRIVRDLYLEAVDGFPRAVVEWTLKYLVFNNPRNTPTFTAPPTPQDVREACQKTKSDWQRWVTEFYFKAPYGERWALPTGRELWNCEKPSFKSVHNRNPMSGAKPGEAGCLVPDDVQIALLQDEVGYQLRQINNAAELEKRGESPSDSCDAGLLVMPDEAFERLPKEAFPDGLREALFTMRGERAERARRRDEHETYLRSLPEIVRRVRRTFAYDEARRQWSEDEIMAETKVRLAKIQRDRADAESDGGIYCGTRFEDGTEYVETQADRRKTSIEAYERQTPEQFEKIKAAKLEELRKAGFAI